MSHFFSRTAMVVLLASAASALAAGNGSDARTQYQKDRAACMTMPAGEDRTICLKEAGAALKESRAGGLTQEPGNYQRNEDERCSAHKGEDRDLCLRQLRGEGAVEGSVPEGGVYRKIIIETPGS